MKSEDESNDDSEGVDPKLSRVDSEMPSLDDTTPNRFVCRTFLLYFVAFRCNFVNVMPM